MADSKRILMWAMIGGALECESSDPIWTRRGSPC